MSDQALTIKRKDKTNLLFLVFSIWTFILLCRPQDYISSLGNVRPNLTLGLLTLLIYFFSATKSKTITGNRQYRLFIYLIVIMIIGVPFSYYRSASLKDVFNYASVTLMFFFLFYQIVNTTSKLRNLLFAYTSGVAIYSINILKFGEFSYERITFGSMFDPNDLAFFFISFLTFNLLFITKENAGYKRITTVINIILCFIVILKTGSRGGLIALISVAAYLMFAKTITVRLSFMIKAALVLMAIVSLPFVTINSDRYKTLFDMKDDYNVTDEEGRIAIWKMGTKMMLSRPLTGVGMYRFNEGVGRDREERGMTVVKWQTAHNSLLQIGAETGIFGLVLFCLMSINVFKITGEIISKSRSEELIKISEMARAGFLGHFVCAMFLSQAYSVYWVFYIVLSAVLKHLLERETSEDGITVSPFS